MKLAVSSYAYNWAVGIPGYPPERPMTVFDLLDKAVQHGVHVVQVVDNIPFEQIPREVQDRFVHNADYCGVEIELGMRGIQSNHLEDSIRLAERMHAKVLRVVVDKGDYRPSMDEIVQTVQAVVPMLVKSGVNLALDKIHTALQNKQLLPGQHGGRRRIRFWR